MKFRQKPIIIEAIQFLNDASSYDLLHWVNTGLYDRNPDPSVIYAKWINDIMIIPSPWGDKIARIGDWIIKDIDGSFYPCESSIFEKTYEAVTE